MREAEAKLSAILLHDSIQTYETLPLDGGGYCLSVQWEGGGQRIFYSVYEVREWLKEQEDRDQ